MDDSLVRELFKTAAKAGAEDMVVVDSQSFHRIDRLNHKQKSPKVEFENTKTCTFYAAIGNGECSAEITPEHNMDSLIQIVQNVVSAAKLANVWGTVQPHVNFGKKFKSASGQNCSSIQHEFESRFPAFDLCIQSGKTGECLNTKDDLAPCLTQIAEDIQKLHSDYPFELTQEIIETDSHIWNSDGFQQVHQFKTRISQYLWLPEQKKICLPDYLFDGAGIWPEDKIHQHLLSAAEIAIKLQYSRENPSDFSQYDGFGMIISPWAMAVLAHESRHLGIDITSSGKIVLDADSCLFSPPSSPRTCHGFALGHSGKAKPTLNLLYARTPSKSVILDVPVRWMRRGNSMFIEFAYVAEIVNQQISRFFQPITLQIDLSEFWQKCTETAEPACRMAFGCIDGQVVIQSIWAYFNVRAMPVSFQWPME